MDSPSETQGIDLLFKKLGHEITEIRTRALESISSKLKHGLIHDADIVQERQLMARLLEWFNFNPAPKQDMVLELLARLTKHSSACDLLVSLGAVTFLSKLRSDIDSNLKSQIDVIMDRLLHVTDKDIIQASSGPRHCVYGSKRNVEDDTEDKPETQHANYGYFTPQTKENADDSTSTITPPIPLVAVGEYGPHRFGGPECLRFPGFPWHSLTGTDRHVLSSTGASLCSPNPHSVRNACSFLLDVIFRDFPPEIFLQRPAIVQTLLTLISSRPGGQLMSGALACLRALADGLHSRLHFYQDPAFYCPRQGLPFHCNSLPRSRLSGLESISESELASRTEAEGARRMERSGGDGRDERSTSTSATTSIRSTPLSQPRNRYPHGGMGSLPWNCTNDDSENDLSSLQRSTITTPQFCVSSLIATLSSIKTESSRLALNIFQTAIPLVKLLSYSIRGESLWTDKSVLAQNLQTQIRQLLEIAGDALLYHYHLDNSLSSNDNTPQSNWVSKHWTNEESKMHRLVYQALSSIVLDLTQAVLPSDQASNVAKSRLNQALYVIACDQALVLASQESQEIAMAYLEHCSPEKYEIVVRARKIFKSFEHTHFFLKDYQDISESEVTFEIMELAESSIDSLPYHSDTRHLKRVIRAISKVFFNGKVDEDAIPLRDICRRVLLRLLAHPLVAIRRTVYDECLKLLCAGINVDVAAENLGHTASYIARFLLDSEILYEICCFGLGDSSRLVSHPAQEILALLLQSRLLVAEEIWEQFCAALSPVLPVLQAYTAETELLQSALKVYLNAAEHKDQEDWNLDFLQANLRCLMLKHRSTRSNTASKLSQVFSENDTLPHITGLTDLLIVDTPLSLIPRDETDCFRIRRCVFQEDAVLRMLSVFRSTSTEESIRIGALRQLATMLDDPGLHLVFLENGGLDSVCRKLKEMVRPNVTVLTDDIKPALASCIMILKLLLRRDESSREFLSRDFDLLIALLRAADLSRLSVASLAEVSVVIALLIFHDVLKIYTRPKDNSIKTDTKKCEIVELSLPATILTRYQIPFLCPTHYAVSIHRTLVPLPSPTCDPLLSGPPLSAMRISWNLAKYDENVVRLCEDFQAKDAQEEKHGDFDLALTKEDYVSITLSDASLLSSSLLDAIMFSQSHSAASHAFSLLRVAIVSSPKCLSLTNTILTSKLDLWKEVLGKFLHVAPSCYEDEVLLINLASLLDEMLHVVESTGLEQIDTASRKVLLWFLEDCVLYSERNIQILGHGSPILRVLESSEPQPEPVSSGNEAHISSVSIRRQLCKEILRLLSRTARLLRSCGDKHATVLFHRELRTVILLRLRLADAPQFYDVPSMEITLECLVHVSAAKMALNSDLSKVKNEPTDRALLQQLLGTLLEIVSAFHIRSGASNLSYMGKGVSKCATQCILHLAREISTLGYMDWTNLLEYTVPSQPTDQTQNLERLGLEWLVPLWSARDPQMRFSGFAIAATVAQTKLGAIALANSFVSCSGGIWNMALCAALDHSECSAVRSQAFNLLSNLVFHKFDGPEIESPSWQGPVVQEEHTGATTCGLPALLALLHHAHMFEHISLILNRYHAEDTVRSPAEITTDLPLDVGSLITDSTIASVAGSGSTEATNMSALTQSGMSNQSPVFLPNKDTPSSVKGTADPSKSHKTPSYPSSPATSIPDGWRSLTTPSLVSSVCRFLCNLMVIAPHDTLHSLMLSGALLSINSVLDASRIQTLLDKLSVASNKKGLCEAIDSPKFLRRSLLTRHLLDQHGTVARLLTLILCAEKSMASRLLSPDETFTRNVLSILAVETSDETWLNEISRVHRNAFAFLCSALHQHMKYPLSPAVLREWRILSSCLISSLNDERRRDLHTTCLRTLALLFRSENISKSVKGAGDLTLSWLLETKKGASCDAEDLVITLVNIFESLIVNPSSSIPGSANEKLMACCHALQNLLACSKVAQHLALKVGFLERCLEELKGQHVRMTLQFTTIQANKANKSLDSKSQSSLSENYDSYLQTISQLLSLLNNLLLDFVNGKEAAATAGLAQILSLLWSWSAQFSALLIPLLRLAVTYTANCTKACSSIVVSPSSTQVSVASALVRLCRDVQGMVLSRSKLPTPVMQLTFNALINSAAAQECRALLYKMSLLELFPASADRGQHPKRSKQQGILLDCWLRLVLALSFHSDGQLNILKIRDFLDILIELNNSNISSYVWLIIRNLCFHGPSKNRLSSNKLFVRVLMNGLNCENEEVKVYTSTAIQSLLCNNQKAKVHLKNSGLVQNLQNALARLTLASEKEANLPFKKSLTTILDTMKS